MSAGMRALAAIAMVAALAPGALAQTPPAAPAAAAAAPAPTAPPRTPTHLRAQPNMPRTWFGAPSLEGVWDTNFLQPLETVAGFPGLTTDKAGEAMIKANTIKQS